MLPDDGMLPDVEHILTRGLAHLAADVALGALASPKTKQRPLTAVHVERRTLHPHYFGRPSWPTDL